MADTPCNWLLKWEVTNFADHIYHTNQLSIIRGGSELAEAAAEEIARLAERPENGAKRIYVAASQALFEVKSKTRAEIVALACELEGRSVASDLQLTSAAGFAKVPGDGTEALKHAIWTCERTIELRRGRLLNVHPGATDDDRPAGKAADLDGFDNVRLADTDVRPSPTDEPQAVSAFSRARYDCGRKRQRRLAELAGTHAPELTSVVQDIRGKPADFPSLAEAGRLGNLIGIVSADGNGFGAFRAKATSIGALRQAGDALRGLMDAVLLAAVRPDLEDLRDDKVTALPIHVLLSAGDEFVLVCRAERALAIAAAIHEAAEEHPVTLPDGTVQNLSFSVGVVVAHNATPIRILKRAAHDLEKQAKDFARPAGGPAGATAFAVFKGVAVSERGVEALREDLFTLRLGDGKAVRLWHGPYAPNDLARAERGARALAKEASHGQLQRFLRDVPGAWRKNPPSGVVDLRKRYLDAVNDLPNIGGASKSFLNELAADLDTPAAADRTRPVVLPLADLDDLMTLSRGVAERPVVAAPPLGPAAGAAAAAGEEVDP